MFGPAAGELLVYIATRKWAQPKCTLNTRKNWRHHRVAAPSQECYAPSRAFETLGDFLTLMLYWGRASPPPVKHQSFL